MTMRVLFPFHGLATWNGGLDLARLLVSGIARQDVVPELELVFVLPQATLGQRIFTKAIRTFREAVAGRLGATTGGAEALLKTAESIAAGHALIRCSDNARGILDAARSSGSDIIFPSMFPLTEGAKRIGYIFDFQHRHLPHLFPARIRRNRDRHFAAVAKTSDGIVVNSRDAARDVERFLHVDPSKILALPFCPYSHAWWFDIDAEEARARYGIPDRYVLVCNHFWKHKDHATALRAFALLRAKPQFHDLHLVLTGDPIDHRDPAHYGQLTALCGQLGIRSFTHFLGLVPKRDQLALMRGSAALFQPTLFEGGPGGGAVYEAIGMGVPSVVSDIPINGEIDQGNVHFFRAGDPEDLVLKAEQVLAGDADRPDPDVLIAQGNANLTRLGNAIANFLEVIACKDRARRR